MRENDSSIRAVEQFLREEIDTVPHLEALLLLWKSWPVHWSREDVAKGLFISNDVAGVILADLVQRSLVVVTGEPTLTYRYESESNRDQLIASVDATYRRELVRISRLIHSRPSQAVRDFARAFHFNKGNG